MPKLTLSDLSTTLSNSAATTINNNNSLIETALENTLSRDGSTPNQMTADIDLNDNDLLNVSLIQAEEFILNGQPLQSGSVTDALLRANNLSDLTNISIARDNLGLGDIATHDVAEFATSAQGALADTALQPDDIGTSVQSYDASLASIAGLTTSSNQIIYTTASDTWTVSAITAFGRSLIDDIDAASARNTLSLGTIATQNSNSVSVTGGTITGITDLAIADGGTGASTAANARTNLGLTDSATMAVESGSFTPVLAFGGGSTGITYSTQTAVYKRIGNLVFVRISITLTNKGSSTGVATISGLPFTADTNSQIPFATSGNMASFSGAAGGLIAPSATSMSLVLVSASGHANMTDANFTNTSAIILAGVYGIASLT